MLKIGLYLMGAKGLHVLSTLIGSGYLSTIAFVVAARDKSVAKDYFQEIQNLAITNGITFYIRSQTPENLDSDFSFAISWRWLIRSQARNLIVFHDSLLPKYRGFAPLITALIEGDKEVGVTAIRANEEFDRGNIIGQERMQIAHPLKIKDAIDAISDLYGSLMLKVLRSIVNEDIHETLQNEKEATYSLWRDDEDYLIDWNQKANRIKRFIDAVGFPYQGAKTYCEGVALRILDAEEVPDMHIVNRIAGKVICLSDGNPVVVCGQGLLLLKNIVTDETNQKYIVSKLRVRLKNEHTIQ